MALEETTSGTKLTSSIPYSLTYEELAWAKFFDGPFVSKRTEKVLAALAIPERCLTAQLDAMEPR